MTEKEHNHQLKRDEATHKQQLERDRLEYHRNQADAKNERIRQACADLLGAILTFEMTVHEANAFGEFYKDREILEAEGKRLSAVLRDALLGMDNARRTLLLYAPDLEVMSTSERYAFQGLAMGIERALAGLPTGGMKLSDQIATMSWRLKRSLPEYVAKL